MKLNRAGLYAIQAVVFLASQEGNPLTASEKIAEATGAPEHFLPKVLHPLVKARVLTSSAGPRGGYRLARPAKGITVLEVVEVIGGPIRAEVPPVEGQALPGLETVCQEAAEAVRKALAKVKLSELAGKK